MYLYFKLVELKVASTAVYNHLKQNNVIIDFNSIIINR